jgi:hypothetical protein
VKKIAWLGATPPQVLRPLPARPAGESDSVAESLDFTVHVSDIPVAIFFVRLLSALIRVHPRLNFSRPVRRNLCSSV